MKTLKTKLATLFAVLALALTSLGLAAPASAAVPAAPSVTAVTPTLGMNAGAYEFWCNFFGAGCKHAKRWNKAGGYYYKDICSDLYCTKFGNFKKHPPLSKTTWSGIYRNY